MVPLSFSGPTTMPMVSEILSKAILPAYTASTLGGSPPSKRKPENQPKEPLRRMEKRKRQMVEQLHRLDERLRHAREKGQQREGG